MKNFFIPQIIYHLKLTRIYLSNQNTAVIAQWQSFGIHIEDECSNHSRRFFNEYIYIYILLQ
jgi:hypothetical protein